MRISDWSSDVCSSDLVRTLGHREARIDYTAVQRQLHITMQVRRNRGGIVERDAPAIVKRREGASERTRFILQRQALHQRVGEADQIGRASCRDRVCKYV